MFDVLLEYLLVGILRTFLYHMSTRICLNNFLAADIFGSRLLFDIQRSNEIGNAKLLSLMFQRSSKICLSLWQLGNDPAHHKLLRQHTTKILEFFHQCLYIMSLFYYGTVINHSVVMKLPHDVQLATGVRSSIFGL